MGIGPRDKVVIGTTDKTILTRLTEVLRKRIIAMVAALGGLQKNKMDGKFGFSVMCQELDRKSVV